MPAKPSTVAEYFEIGCGRCPLGSTSDCKVLSWVDAMREAQRILLETALTEEIKWHVPCYTYDGHNVLLLSAFKDDFTISFFKGALLKDPHGVLVQPTANSHESRLLRFKTVDDVLTVEDIIKAYVAEAIEIEKAGLSVPPKPVSAFDMPDELVSMFEDDPNFEAAFEALTPGRQKGYLLHFSGAKQSATRQRRIEKYMPLIFEGKGMHDR